MEHSTVNDLMHLPESIRRFISEKTYRMDEVGMSRAKILVFDDCVLKIEKIRRKNDDTVEMIRWLEGKLPVPKVIRYDQDDSHQFLLMSKARGG